MAGTRPGHFVFRKNRVKSVAPASSLHDDLDLVARLQPVVVAQAVEHAETFERVVGHAMRCASFSTVSLGPTVTIFRCESA